MPHLTTDDGVKLYYEEVGRGIPIVFVHEFAGDFRSYESQVRYFGQHYRCISFNARGYPPSDVPKDGERYSQERARDDIRAVLDALKIDKAHIVGLSMGGFATLHFGFTYPNQARSLTIAGCGYGAAPDKRAQFAEEAEAAAKGFETQGMAKAAEAYALGPTRVQFQNKDPRGWKEFVDQLREHSTEGAAFTMRGVQKRRPSLFDLVDKMKQALLAEDPGASVLPYCLSGGTDNKALSTLGITGYGFAPLRLPADLDFAPMFHGIDERVPVESLEFGARALQRLLIAC